MINVKETESSIQLLESFVSDCKFDNRLISLGSDTTLTNNLEVSVSNQIFNSDKTFRLGYVRIIVSGRLEVEDNANAYCDYRLVVEGEFSVPSSVAEKEFSQLLWFNGSSVLYGIARAKMEVLSSMMFNSGKITLPMVNMIEFLKKQAIGKTPSSQTE